MGMFDKDRLYGGERLTDHVKIGHTREGTRAEPEDVENVLLLDCVIVSEEVPTDIGLATKTELLLNKLSEDGTTLEGEPFKVNTLAQAIAEKAKAKTDGDLPAVVCFFVTPSGTEGYSDATVMQFVRPWDGKTPKFQPLEEALPF